jgi:hypothetical protein
MRRRDFIKVITGSAVTWPLAARAQQPSASRRVGVLMNLSEADPAAQLLIATFREGLELLGWVPGHALSSAPDQTSIGPTTVREGYALSARMAARQRRKRKDCQKRLANLHQRRPALRDVCYWHKADIAGSID